MTYSPVLHVGSGTWMVGRIQSHIAKPLSKDEVERVCASLNVEAAPTDAEVERAWFKQGMLSHEEMRVCLEAARGEGPDDE